MNREKIRKLNLFLYGIAIPISIFCVMMKKLRKNGTTQLPNGAAVADSAAIS